MNWEETLMRKCDRIVIRVFDVIASLLALIAISPVFGITMLLLRFTGEGEIFYTQERVGKGGRYFQLVKFATMLKDSANMQNGTVTVKNDPRILPFGNVLRKSKINELPQLINIIKGDMSLIGPRPMTEETISYYTDSGREVILSCKPGLSGVGSVIFRNEEDLLAGEENPKIIYQNLIAPYKESLEVWYVENQSLALYLRLIYTTLIVVLTKKASKLNITYQNMPSPPKGLETRL